MFGPARLKHAFGNFRRQDHTKAARVFGWGRVRSHARHRQRSATLGQSRAGSHALHRVRSARLVARAHPICQLALLGWPPVRRSLLHMRCAVTLPLLLIDLRLTFLLTPSTPRHPIYLVAPFNLMLLSHTNRRPKLINRQYSKLFYIPKTHTYFTAIDSLVSLFYECYNSTYCKLGNSFYILCN